jgi:hypothetical protein
MVLDMPDRWDTSVVRSMPPTADDMATGNPGWGGDLAVTDSIGKYESV